MELWDLTFRIDRNHVLGTLQYETRDRHVKIQMEAHVWIDDYAAIDPFTNEVISYQELSGLQLCNHGVSTHMRQINRSLQYAQLSISCLLAFLLSVKQRTDEKR